MSDTESPPKKRGQPPKYKTDEERQAAFKQQIIDCQKKKQQTKWRCDMCDKDYNYFAKSAHLKSVGHKKLVNALQRIEDEKQKENKVIEQKAEELNKNRYVIVINDQALHNSS